MYNNVLTVPETTGTLISSIPRRRPLTAKVGVFGVGHETYWSQFPGLLDELDGKLKIFCNKIKRFRVECINFGIVDNASESLELLPKLKAADLDLIFVDMLTYATSSTIGAIFRGLDVPIVLVALQPMAAMDYSHGTTYMQLCNDDFCSVPEFLGVAFRMGCKVPEVIIGTLEGDPVSDTEIEEWCRIAHVFHDLRRARLGHLGHVLESMLDMHTDPTALTAAFGVHVVQCEPDQILQFYSEDYSNEIEQKKNEIINFFEMPNPISDPLTTRLTETDLHIAAKAAVALEMFVDDQRLDGLAYYYEAAPGTPMRELMTNLIVGNSLLTGAGFPMCGEFDIKTCVAMLMMDRLGIGGSFAEFHPIDFVRETVLVGHDGPHHLNIADRKPVLRSLKKYHGKPGFGASVEFNIRKGPITMLSIGVKPDGKFKLIVAEGESLKAPIPPTGNTNTHGYFGTNIRRFLKHWVAEGPTHHFSLGIGHHAQTIRKIANALDLECVIVS
ncbi:MAG: L-fucose/L-arabinose isomerase family protein [Planctomycetaceae bacterium]|jgi:L-arabinose isomerase|nr:L-fucose/L-arabinose isomerase family protein [Planctomycetaceae bacterium]